MTLIPLPIWAVLICAAVVLMPTAKADPFIAAEAGNVRLVVHTEPCALKEVVNLARRATWTEGGKIVEGCAGYYKETEMVCFYFADKTVIAVPAHMFARVTGA